MAPRSSTSDKSRGVALALAVPLGVFGAHRFYAGKIGTGLLQLVTLGGLGLWYLYDLILIAAGGFKDADGKVLRRWDFEATGFEEDAEGALYDEVAQLRQEVAELHERVDFTERLLARTQERRGVGGTAE